MAQYSRAEAADRAGVDRGYVDRLIELGIVTPDHDDRLSGGDIRWAAKRGIGLHARPLVKRLQN